MKGNLVDLMAAVAGEEAAIDIQAFTILSTDHMLALEAREVSQVQPADSERQAKYLEDQVADWEDRVEDLVLGLQVGSKKK